MDEPLVLRYIVDVIKIFATNITGVRVHCVFQSPVALQLKTSFECLLTLRTREKSPNSLIESHMVLTGLFFDSFQDWDLRLPQLIDNQPRLMSINELTLTSYRPRPRNLQAQPGQPSKDYSFFDDLCCHFEVGL